MKHIAIMAALMAGISGQTRLNLAGQATNPDFALMQHTRPAQVGTAIPATCQAGELFFHSAAANGQNLLGCVSTNTWASMSGTNAVISTTQQAEAGVDDTTVMTPLKTAQALNAQNPLPVVNPQSLHRVPSSNGVTYSLRWPLSPSEGRYAVVAMNGTTAPNTLGTGFRAVSPTGALTIAAPTTLRPLRLQYTTGSAANNSSRWDGDTNDPTWLIGSNLIIDTTVSISRISDVRFHLGLYTDPTVLNSGDSPATAAVGFRFSTSAGDTSWSCYTFDGTLPHVASANVIPIAGQDMRLSIVEDNANSQYYFLVNGALKCTVPAANVATAGTPLKLGISATTLVASDMNMTLAGIYLRADR